MSVIVPDLYNNNKPGYTDKDIQIIKINVSQLFISIISCYEFKALHNGNNVQVTCMSHANFINLHNMHNVQPRLMQFRCFPCLYACYMHKM